jgi:predicted SprT family Zn-dependent metalloprotease
MIISISFIQEKFKTFNALIFGSKLPEVPIILSRAKTFAGKCTYRCRRSFWGKTENYDFALRFSTRLDLPEVEWEDVIIHEMIHYYIGVTNKRDTSVHGTLFCGMMEEINRVHHRNITISRRSGSDVMVPDERTRYRVIACVEMSDGKTGFKVLPRTQSGILKFYRSVQPSPTVRGVSFFWSKDSFFSKYPCSSAPRVYFTEREKLEGYKKEGIPIGMEKIMGK